MSPDSEGRLLAEDALQRIGKREQPGTDPAVALAAGEAAQFGRIAVGTDRQRGRHGGISEDNATKTPQPPNRSVTNSSDWYQRRL